jgi:hypothetical protein
VKLAVLFWFYADFELCRERLALLRAFNPETPIYGLYGGPLEQAAEARGAVGDQLDDFYAFPEPRTPQWKWLHGDRLVAAWARDRGGELAWDTVVLVQWDMLVLAPLEQLFGGLGSGEAVFSGLRPAAEIASWWGWLKGEDPDKRAEAEAFRELLHGEYGYDGELWCCLFIVIALPRALLQRYAAAGPPEPGFLEYKLPTLARVFGTPATDGGFRPWWGADPATRDAPPPARVLNAVGEEVALATILGELARAAGARVFHPYRGRFPAWLARPRAVRLARALGVGRA